jgi:hypothetical protein
MDTIAVFFSDVREQLCYSFVTAFRPSGNMYEAFVIKFEMVTDNIYAMQVLSLSELGWRIRCVTIEFVWIYI